MALTGAEKQKAYRDRKRNAHGNGNAQEIVTRVTKGVTGAESLEAGNKRYRQGVQEVTGVDIGEEPSATVGCKTCGCIDQALVDGECQRCKSELHPLDVYSPARWAYLQSRGYVWDVDDNVAVLAASSSVGGQITAVTVPGDPGYRGLGRDRVVVWVPERQTLQAR